MKVPGRLWGLGGSWRDPRDPLAGDSARIADTGCGVGGVAMEAGCSAGLLSGSSVAGAGALV